MSTPHRQRPPSLYSIRHRYFPPSKLATLFYKVTLTVMSRYWEPYKGSWKLALRQWGGEFYYYYTTAVPYARISVT